MHGISFLKIHSELGDLPDSIMCQELDVDEKVKREFLDRFVPSKQLHIGRGVFCSGSQPNNQSFLVNFRLVKSLFFEHLLKNMTPGTSFLFGPFSFRNPDPKLGPKFFNGGKKFYVSGWLLISRKPNYWHHCSLSKLVTLDSEKIITFFESLNFVSWETKKGGNWIDEIGWIWCGKNTSAPSADF